MYKKVPTKAYDVYDRLKYREFYFASFHTVLSIEQLKKQVTTFPYFGGVNFAMSQVNLAISQINDLISQVTSALSQVNYAISQITSTISQINQ